MRDMIARSFMEQSSLHAINLFHQSPDPVAMETTKHTK